MKKNGKQLVRYQDLRCISVCDSGETFLSLNEIGIKSGYWKTKKDMMNILNGNILVRKAVGLKIKSANELLQKAYPTLALFCLYGYRSMEIQIKSFQKTLSEMTQNIFIPDPTELYEKVHRQIAVPTVAGHQTGGAIDMCIINVKNKKLLNFGSKPYDYSRPVYSTYSKAVSTKARKNRLILRNVMIKTGFAPYDGEWWHFSYGDREWAYYYGKKYSIYKQVSVSEIKTLTKNILYRKIVS